MGLVFKFDFEAAKAALVYLASKNLPSFDKYRAVKLLFLADREHLLRFGRPITGDSYSANRYGPTPNTILDLLDDLERVLVNGKDPSFDASAELVKHIDVVLDEKHDHPVYVAKSKPDFDALSQTDVMVLDNIAGRYGHETFAQLMKMTHGFEAYKRAWRGDGIRNKFPMSFDDLFAEAPEQTAFLKELQENQRLQELFPNPFCVQV